jgi:CheY-like chemotaxis protein
MTTHEAPLIMLVEDHPDDEFLALRVLARNGYTNVAVARNGIEALDLLRRMEEGCDGLTLPVLILLDMKLPKKDGIEILEHLRKNPATKEIQVISLSSSTDPRESARCKELGVICSLVKPLTTEKLQAVLQKVKPASSP